MKNIIIILLLISSSPYAQEVYNGKIIDKNSKESLPYVNIGVVGKNIGTVSNYNGDFQIEVDKKYHNDTLKISMIGYKSLTFNVSNFKALIRKNSILQMEKEITELKEFVVSSKGLKEKILGNKTTSKTVSLGFTSNNLGNEIGVKIKIKKSPTYLKDFNVSIVKNEFNNLKFRLNFYDVKDGKPNKSILKENIIVTSTKKEGVLTVALDKYNIVVYNDFFVTLEWIEDLGDKEGLTFSAGFAGSATVVRSTSQDNWEKIGAISVGLNVTAEY
ncbi:MAG: carboxypeptidase-like regulatory domain-containing protein [Vicingaceae bacterium]|nr:carboxypeptidase-like regulatory domain-containing protein [Vicingaceae bacterium]